jgi:hypothetical protein
MPVPALITCASPGGWSSRLPRLSSCASAPSSTQVEDLHVAVAVRGEAPPGATLVVVDHRSARKPMCAGSM